MQQETLIKQALTLHGDDEQIRTKQWKTPFCCKTCISSLETPTLRGRQIGFRRNANKDILRQQPGCKSVKRAFLLFEITPGNHCSNRRPANVLFCSLRSKKHESRTQQLFCSRLLCVAPCVLARVCSPSSSSCCVCASFPCSRRLHVETS